MSEENGGEGGERLGFSFKCAWTKPLTWVRTRFQKEWNLAMQKPKHVNTIQHHSTIGGGQGSEDPYFGSIWGS